MGIATLADLMVKHAVKRMPVVRDGRVVGIVSRSDLMVAIARSQETPRALTRPSDRRNIQQTVVFLQSGRPVK
jgi:CBS domain-containing protein